MSGGRSSILTFHSLDRSGSAISLDPALFRTHVESLARRQVPVVPLPEVVNTPGSVSITFDDGFENFYEHGFPPLAENRITATVFVVSGHCGRRNDWPQPVRGIPILDLMTWSRLDEIARHGIVLGAHTASHPFLSQLSDQAAERELRDSRREIEDRTGRPVDLLCYPYGDSNPAVRRAAQSLFRLACGTRLGYVEPASDPFDLPRLDMYYLRSPFWFKRVHSGLGRGYLAARGGLRAARRALAG